MTRLEDSGLLLSRDNSGFLTLMLGNKHSRTNAAKDKKVSTSSNSTNNNINNNINNHFSTRSNLNMISQIKMKAKANTSMTTITNTNPNTTSLPNGTKIPSPLSTL